MSVPIHRINVLSYCNDLFNVENDVSLKIGQKYPEMFYLNFTSLIREYDSWVMLPLLK